MSANEENITGKIQKLHTAEHQNRTHYQHMANFEENVIQCNCRIMKSILVISSTELLSSGKRYN